MNTNHITYTAGLLGLHLQVEILDDEMRTWPPDRITRFFQAVAVIITRGKPVPADVSFLIPPEVIAAPEEIK